MYIHICGKQLICYWKDKYKDADIWGYLEDQVQQKNSHSAVYGADHLGLFHYRIHPWWQTSRNYWFSMEIGSTLQWGLMSHTEGKGSVRCMGFPMGNLQPLSVLVLYWCCVVQRWKQQLLLMKAFNCDTGHNKASLALIWGKSALWRWRVYFVTSLNVKQSFVAAFYLQENHLAVERK